MKKYRVIGNTSRHGFSIGEIVTKISIDNFSNGNDCWYIDYRDVEQIKKEKPMNLKAGRYYKTRDGRVFGPMKYNPDAVGNMCWNDPSGVGWTSKGTVYSLIDDDADLIARHHKAPSKKKLMRVIQHVWENDDTTPLEKILKKWGDTC
jgi:hypothetical protein